ncbi:MAG: N-6 DNA methylase [Corynebacterium sp.]|uniref:DNA methyltransferase n=1 Tax=Corynebacterium sp. TaxID=1720 RepID=UPI0026E0C541|nr:DNA methyltransferase [Corynebacterium sp.]MDO5668627.1 N-6 DNA methylase [Corynebacterium sp.]
MAKLSLKAVEARIEPLGYRESYDREFIFELLDAYGKPKSSLTRLRTGSLNVAAEPDVEVAQKNVVYFREVPQGQALEAVEELRAAAHVVRYTPRFVIATDFEELVALDMKTRENLVIPIRDIAAHFTFFLPWAGMEKAQYVAEAHADVRAAERMGKLFDELLTANTDLITSPAGRHSLNVFFTRLLFCFFAEDTGVFTENQFTNAVGSHTLPDGSDTRDFLTDLFSALDTPVPQDKPTHLRDFPYVNGRLFSADAAMVVPDFTAKARTLLIDLGTLMWQEINPDIFGSMFQAIVSPGTRSDLGQHYTSVPNILKTIEPLFLDELKERFDAAYDSIPQLNRLYDRIAGITIFDPACGSGNFLVIAYKELRRLEHAILDRLASLNKTQDALFTDSRINIENFFGIEIDDFAVEVAILSMWIAKHQMNAEFAEKFGISIPLIPLKETGNIVAGNAARLDWNQVCPNNGTDEIYLISNPPYGGSKKQTKEQKEDYEFVFGARPFSKNLDYIALWFIKGADYIRDTRAELSLVSTNSVVQGEHVALMFPMIFDMGIEIGYAYTSFKWENNAKYNAGVTVVVVSLRMSSDKPKYIFTDDLRIRASNINGYLADGPFVTVARRTKPTSNVLPSMVFGSMPNDGGNLLLTTEESNDLIKQYPQCPEFLKRFIGASELISGRERWALWLDAKSFLKLSSIPPILERIEKVREHRISSKRPATQKLAAIPYSFGHIAYKPTNSIIVPSVSSERRDYIPIGYLGPDTVISNLAFAVYDAEPWLFALLTSRMHMVWVRAVGGKMKTDFRYSNTIVYNNFPVPPLSTHSKEELTELALRVLDVREYHCEFTLAQLYDPDKMPANLRQAHAEVDAAVDKLYSTRAFETDEARLSTLFAMYEDAIAAEKK